MGSGVTPLKKTVNTSRDVPLSVLGGLTHRNAAILDCEVFDHVIGLLADCDERLLQAQDMEWIQTTLALGDAQGFNLRCAPMTKKHITLAIDEAMSSEDLARDLQHCAEILAIWDPQYLEFFPILKRFSRSNHAG